MSAAFLLSFSVFETKDFHIGGILGQVEDMQARWVQSAKGLEKDQTHLAGVDLSGYTGSKDEGLVGTARICLR